MASDVALQIEGLQTRFRDEKSDLAAVNHVSLTLKRGTVLAIVGESGCGKTVTAYSILRLIQPPGYIAAGRIVFHPRDGSAPIDLAALDENADDFSGSVFESESAHDGGRDRGRAPAYPSDGDRFRT